MIADLVVRYGTAENLARLWFVRKCAVPVDHVDDVMSFLLGHVGGPHEERALCRQLDADLEWLWSLIEGLHDPDRLDELTEEDWDRHTFPSHAHEADHRYRATRERVAADIEGAIRMARYRAAEARRTERTVPMCVRPGCGHDGAHHHAVGCDARVTRQAVCGCAGFTTLVVPA